MYAFQPYNDINNLVSLVDGLVHDLPEHPLHAFMHLVPERIRQINVASVEPYIQSNDVGMLMVFPLASKRLAIISRK
jgi:hypothetical protein